MVRDRHPRVPAPRRPDRRRPRLDRRRLKIKPILTLEEEITPVERVRTRARSIERLRDYARQRHESGADAWVVQHIQDAETADALVDDCREIFGCEPAFVSEIGAVLGAHVGPGLLGVGSVRTEPDRLGGASALRRRRSIARRRRRSRRRRRRRSARAVLADLAAPVGELGDPGAERLDRAAEVLALDVDVAADLAPAERPGGQPGGSG